MAVNLEDILKLLLAVTAGGLIGIEREYRDKAAGFRTLIFICAGACLFTILSARLTTTTDPNRIAANIVTGVGFLGAGVILRDGGKVIGLTTAATIWLIAAVGMGIGGGQYLLAGIMVLITMLVLWFLPALEYRIDNVREERRYEIVSTADINKIEALEQAFRETGLKLQGHSQVKTGDLMTLSWTAAGSPAQHAAIMRILFEHPEIHELKC